MTDLHVHICEPLLRIVPWDMYYLLTDSFIDRPFRLPMNHLEAFVLVQDV